MLFEAAMPVEEGLVSLFQGFTEETVKDSSLSVITAEIHHKLPLSEGGTHDRSNLIALCKSCHSSIHAHRGDYWGNRQG